jgi:multiple sugar transport system substrate-binding protein
VRRFQEEHANITVQEELIAGDVVEGLTARQAGGALQDVIQVPGVQVKAFAIKQIAANMEELAKKDAASQALLKDVYPLMLDHGRVKTKPGLYMLPWALDVLVVYYNKNMFQSAGVELPKPTWTVDDQLAAAKRLTRDTGDPGTSQYGIGFNFPAWTEYGAWVRGYGGDMLAADGRRCVIDGPAAIDAIEAMTALVTRHKVAPPPGTNFGGDAFQLGKVAMMATIRNGAAQLRKAKVEFDWDAEIRPAFPKQRLTGMGTHGWAVSTQTKSPEAAWKLTSYMISRPAQEIFARSYATVPVLRSMRNDASWRSLPAPPNNHEAFVKAADFGTIAPEFPLECGSANFGTVSQIMRDAITDVLGGKQGASTALRDAAAKINSCMAANPEPR